MIALKCETDFVAKNADFVALAKAIIDAAVANKCQTLEEVKALPMGNGTVADAVVERSGVTGEKMELDGYQTVTGEQVVAYNHMNGNFLCTLVALNKTVDEQIAKNVAMQVAAMNPIALDEASVPQSVKDSELRTDIEKAKQNQIDKAIEVALKKAGINPAHVDTEDHMESNMGKGWITAEDVAKAKEIKKTVAEEKAANLPEQMIQNIAQGMLNKFFKESCLMSQAYIDDSKINVAQYLESVEKGLTVTDFKRFTLRAE
jgi:elongation factor Ts